jgi:hypothetical protein
VQGSGTNNLNLCFSLEWRNNVKGNKMKNKNNAKPKRKMDKSNTQNTWLLTFLAQYTDTTEKNGEVKLVLCAQTSPPREKWCSHTSAFHMSNILLWHEARDRSPSAVVSFVETTLSIFENCIRN